MFMSGLYLCFLWQTQSFLDTLEARGSFRTTSLMFRGKGLAAIISSDTGDTKTAGTTTDKKSIAADTDEHKEPDASSNTTPSKKFIVFKGFVNGQGAGNIVSGLLAAHLLGIEFNRTVCVDRDYVEFHHAFEAVYPHAVAECPNVLDSWKQYKEVLHISLVNFGKTPNECELQEQLASDSLILNLTANTYPRWPVVPDNLFFTYYKAKPELLKILPYDPSQPPKTVVHLRQPDRYKDVRKGLDQDTFRALGGLLPPDTYLVTNRVEWFDYFDENYQWKHPEWQQVVHSALKMSWGGRDHDHVRPDEDADHVLQMWADWYTILTAKMVYHTHSDFSISAIHWQNLHSKEVMGFNHEEQKLELIDESWRIDGETAPLVDRRVGGQGTSVLRNCQSLKTSREPRAEFDAHKKHRAEMDARHRQQRGGNTKRGTKRSTRSRHRQQRGGNTKRGTKRSTRSHSD
jgi:hypothetical protein